MKSNWKRASWWDPSPSLFLLLAVVLWQACTLRINVKKYVLFRGTSFLENLLLGFMLIWRGVEGNCEAVLLNGCAAPAPSPGKRRRKRTKAQQRIFPFGYSLNHQRGVPTQTTKTYIYICIYVHIYIYMYTNLKPKPILRLVLWFNSSNKDLGAFCWMLGL